MALDPFADLYVALVNHHEPDTGLDVMAMALDDYIETRDESLIKVKSGAFVTLFQVQRLSWRFCAQVVDRMPAGHQRDMIAFAASCHAIYQLDSAGVKTELMQTKAIRDSVNQTLIASDTWLDQVAERFTPWALYEVGEVARQFAMMTATSRKVFSYPAG